MSTGSDASGGIGNALFFGNLLGSSDIQVFGVMPSCLLVLGSMFSFNHTCPPSTVSANWLAPS